MTNGGSAAADVAQRLVQSGKTLGSARALELAAALCAGFRRALGLRQEEQTLPVQEEEEEPQKEVPTKCTFASTSGAFVEQHWYNCATCGLVGDKGACAACIRTCHAGHDISYARKSSFFCDCGARGSTTAADRAAQRERESFLGGDIPGGRRGASAAALLAAAPLPVSRRVGTALPASSADDRTEAAQAGPSSTIETSREPRGDDEAGVPTCVPRRGGVCRLHRTRPSGGGVARGTANTLEGVLHSAKTS